MNLQFIAAQYRQFRLRDLTGWGAPLDQVLEALFSGLVDKGFLCSFDELLPKERLKLYTLFDLSFMSDEQCELHVLEVDGKPLGIAHKFADRSEWDSHIIDADLFKKVAREMAIAVLDRNLENVTVQPLERLSDLRNGYIYFLDEAETMFAVRSPAWMYGFQNLPSEHKAFYVDPLGHAHPVKAIGKFVDPEAGHGAATRHDVTVTLESGLDVVVDGSQLMFELLANQGDVTAALTTYTDPSAWCVGDIVEGMNQAVVYQHVQNRWTSQCLFVTFETLPELERFVVAYHRTEPAEELIVPGYFDLGALGFKGNVVQH